MARPVVMAVFRNTQCRWLRAAVGSTAFCITDSDSKHEVLAKVMALAARRYGAAAAGVVIADIDEAAAPDAVLPDNTHVIHANIFALFKTFSQEMKAMPTQQAFELAKDLCIIGRNRIQGRVIEVIDPLWPRSGPGTPRDSAIEAVPERARSSICLYPLLHPADMPPEPLNKDPYKCSAYRLQYTSALRPAEAQELVLQAAARVQSTRAVAEAPGYVAINMPSRSCRAHYQEVATKLRAQCGDTVSLVQPEQDNRIIGQEEIRRIFATAPAAIAAPMVSLLPLSRAPGVADGAMVPVSMRGATSMSLDPDLYQAFNSQRLHEFMDNNQRPQKQWNGYIIKVYYTPLLFQLRLPDNQFQRVSYFRTTSGEPEFTTAEHLSDHATSCEGWHVAESHSPSNPMWQEFPHADKHNICARIRETTLLCSVVGAAAVVISSRRDSVLAPDFYLFVHLKNGCRPTRDGIISFLATMKKVSGRFRVRLFHTHLPSARSGYRYSVPKDSMGDLCDEGWLMVTDQGGVRTPWPAASDVEVPQVVAARGFGLDNAAMLGCITEAATCNVAHAIKYGSEQQVCDAIVALAPGAPQQALAVLKHLFVEHGADVLEKVLGRYACDAAKEEAEQLRAGIAAAKREAEELQIQHSINISDVGKLRARQHQECHTLRAELQQRQQEVDILRAMRSALSEKRYDLWTELTMQCKARGIVTGQYTAESDAIFEQAQHNDDHRSQLANVLKEQQRLREQYDAALEKCDMMQD
ncbi:hypothetical protein JKP88DRAFT_240837 [Tribonema minus]|uniref:Uncharacterized protein n=1 Tax=Tribonema minus TaxID=303371 RepID=A0A835Z4D7_9STRA|nr:hypothetical protein JKP88DRAFT_240837 [Tribonema minus]